MIELPWIDTGKPVLIAGPTASGKSALALALAQKYNGIIINADALQVYECWQVLTARPNAKELEQAPHHLYGHITCDHKFSVGEWLRDVEALLADTKGRLPIIVGGTGLYFSSLTSGLANIPNVSTDIRNKSTSLIANDQVDQMISDLQAADKETHDKIDLQNPARIARAWEVLTSTGKGLAAWQNETPAPLLPLEKTNAFVVNAPKENLTPRIEKRFRKMLETGALDECRANLENWDPSRSSARAIGAAELISYLKGELELEQAITLSVIATRQYAKRQRSWFRSRMKDWQWLEMGI